MRFANRTNGRAAAGTAADWILGAADVDLDILVGQTKRFGHDLSNHRASAGAEILCAAESFHRSIGIDFQQAVGLIRSATPGVQSNAESIDDGSAGLALAMGMPLGFPIHDLGPNLQLFFVDRTFAVVG